MYLFLIYFFSFFLIVWLVLYYRFIGTKWGNINNSIHILYRDQLQTGDILLLDYQNFSSIFLASLFKVNYIHPVMIIKEKEEIFICELINYPDLKGLKIIPYNKWKGKNKTSIYNYNKLIIKNEKEGDREEINRKIFNYVKRYENLFKDGPEGFSWKWKRFWYPKKNMKNIKTKYMTCVEIMIYMLEYIGIIDIKENQNFLPDAFYNTKDISTKKKLFV